jgi:putative flippase GtrA
MNMGRQRLIRYTLLGTLCFGIDYGVALILISMLPLLIANTLAFLAANLVNFIVGHYWVFRPANRQHRLFRTYAFVLAISGVGLLLNNAVVWLGVAMLGFGLFVTKCAATGVVLGWNFMARVLLVYRHPQKT